MKIEFGERGTLLYNSPMQLRWVDGVTDNWRLPDFLTKEERKVAEKTLRRQEKLTRKNDPRDRWMNSMALKVINYVEKNPKGKNPRWVEKPEDQAEILMELSGAAKLLKIRAKRNPSPLGQEIKARLEEAIYLAGWGDSREEVKNALLDLIQNGLRGSGELRMAELDSWKHR
jgi:hypothetical protein